MATCSRVVDKTAYNFTGDNGSRMKTCNKCKKELPLSSFNRNKSCKDGYHGACRECKKVYQNAWYRSHQGQHYGSTRKILADFKAWVDSLKVGPCSDCHQEYPPYVLDWDHLPGTIKLYNVAKLRTLGSKSLVLAEIAKCELVCANCHRIRTYQRMGLEA